MASPDPHRPRSRFTHHFASRVVRRRLDASIPGSHQFFQFSNIEKGNHGSIIKVLSENKKFRDGVPHIVYVAGEEAKMPPPLQSWNHADAPLPLRLHACQEKPSSLSLQRPPLHPKYHLNATISGHTVSSISIANISGFEDPQHLGRDSACCILLQVSVFVTIQSAPTVPPCNNYAGLATSRLPSLSRRYHHNFGPSLNLSLPRQQPSPTTAPTTKILTFYISASPRHSPSTVMRHHSLLFSEN